MCLGRHPNTRLQCCGQHPLQRPQRRPQSRSSVEATRIEYASAGRTGIVLTWGGSGEFPDHSRAKSGPMILDLHDLSQDLGPGLGRVAGFPAGRGSQDLDPPATGRRIWGVFLERGEGEGYAEGGNRPMKHVHGTSILQALIAVRQ